MRRGGHTTTAAVVCSQWLRQHCDQVKLIDASWSLNKKTGVSHVTKLPGSKYFDIDEIADKSSGLPHMLPSASVFEAKMDELGISNKDKVVVFDQSDGQFVASARVWWTFRAFGHDEVHVLAGGLKGWPKDLPVPQQEKVSGGNRFVARKNASLVWSKQEVLNNLERKDKFQIVDARSRERFYCQEDEPRPEVPRGSIPGSFNVPYTSLFQTVQNAQGENMKVFKNEDELHDIFRSAGVDLEKNIVTSCGSGVTACVVALALHHLGHPFVAVYDGSWTEWAMANDTPKAIPQLTK
jgi:thiosulfate/3-mercaptopyruvate sulfurtransferase